MTLPFAYFDRMYDAAEDPWGFASRWYEERKRTVLLASLPQARFASAYEPGCSIGVLTRQLASRCDMVLAADASPAALERAALRLAAVPNVRLERHRLPADWPREATFELVVLSELLYYFGAEDLVSVAEQAVAAVAAGGCLVSTHWRHPVPEYPQSGDDVQRALAQVAAGRLEQTVAHVEDDFGLSVHVRRRPGEAAGLLSVAQRAGLC